MKTKKRKVTYHIVNATAVECQHGIFRDRCVAHFNEAVVETSSISLQVFRVSPAFSLAGWDEEYVRFCQG